MKASIPFQISISGPSGAKLKNVLVEVVCVYGPPTGDPSLKPIPLTIKEVVAEGKPLEFSLKEMFLNAVGGEEALCKMLEGG